MGRDAFGKRTKTPEHLSRCVVRELLCSGKLMNKGMHSCCQRPADAEVQHLRAAK